MSPNSAARWIPVIPQDKMRGREIEAKGGLGVKIYLLRPALVPTNPSALLRHDTGAGARGLSW
jgi:hypothetical protein